MRDCLTAGGLEAGIGGAFGDQPEAEEQVFQRGAAAEA
jgi:hypothetical protein